MGENCWDMSFFASNYIFFFFLEKRFKRKLYKTVFMTPSFLFSAELSPDTYCTLLVFWSNINETSLDMFEHVFWCLGSGFVKNVGNDQGFERIRREEEKKKTKIQLIYESLFCLLRYIIAFFCLLSFIKETKNELRSEAIWYVKCYSCVCNL